MSKVRQLRKALRQVLPAPGKIIVWRDDDGVFLVDGGKRLNQQEFDVWCDNYPGDVTIYIISWLHEYPKDKAREPFPVGS